MKAHLLRLVLGGDHGGELSEHGGVGLLGGGFGLSSLLGDRGRRLSSGDSVRSELSFVSISLDFELSRLGSGDVGEFLRNKVSGVSAIIEFDSCGAQSDARKCAKD